MEFFNFGNAQTYHFFQWVYGSGKVDVPALVQKAFALVDVWFEMGEGVSEVARDELADLLEGVLNAEIEELPGDWGMLIGVDEIGIADFGGLHGTPYDLRGSLLMPILAAAIGLIDLQAVAKAILIRERKWAPDESVPEVL